MNKDWKVFLEDQGAVLVENQVGEKTFFEIESFGDSELEKNLSEQDVIFSTYNNFSLIKVEGDDAESFLQNQLTNDVRNITDKNHQQTAWCNPKGRMIANFRVYKKGEAFFLSMASDLTEHVLKKLQMYVMMSKVTLEDVTENYARFTIAGDNIESNLTEIFEETLANLDQNEDIAFHTNAVSILRLKGSLPRFDIIATIEEAKILWQKCKTLAKPVSGTGNNYLNILSGIPEITSASSEAWIPQMVNYIQVGGVDFKKGCYPGQEVVARLNYLGKTKRRMYLLELKTNDKIITGQGIANDSDNDAGKILNAVQSNTNTVNALAVLKIAAVNEGNLKLAESNSEVSVLDLPYAVEDE